MKAVNAMGLVFYRKRGLDHSVGTFSALEALKAIEQYRMEQHVVKEVLYPRFRHMVDIW